MAQHNLYGKWGENIACELLVSKGYAIRERNWRNHGMEIDIIAMHRNRIVFVEVKSRTSSNDDALAAIDRRKIARMVRAANLFVRTYNVPHEIQYDIITIGGTPDNYNIEHIEDAFMAPLSTKR